MENQNPLADQPKTTFSSYTPLLVLLPVFVGFIFALAWQLDFLREKRSWTFASGITGGAYESFVQELTKELNGQSEYERFKPIGSMGSHENAQLVSSAEAAFGIIQSDVETDSNIQLVSGLYSEWLHILTTNPDVRGLEDLAKLQKISLGPEGSGSRRSAEYILEHFEVELSDRLVDVELEIVDIPEAFSNEKIDAAIVLAPPGLQLIKKVFSTPGVNLVPISAQQDAATGLSLRNPAYRPVAFPPHIYGQSPSLNVRTIAVDAMLVAHAGVDPSVVRKVAETIYYQRNDLSKSIQFPLRLDSYRPESARFPYHPGAVSYYLREQPNWFVRYAEAISLVLTLMVGIWSVTTLLLKWIENRKKERIDRFYWLIAETAKLPVENRLARLRNIQLEAFEQLTNEKLAADESFVIFHDYLLSELAQVEREMGAS